MPLLTITSDIGQQDFLVAAIKGQLLQQTPSLNIIDITHQLSAFNFPQAAYVCKNALKHFEKGTFHLILVNVFDQRLSHLLLAEHNGQYIGCADNGLLTMILDGEPEKVVALPLEKTAHKTIVYCSSIFAQAFSALQSGKKIEEIGNPDVAIQIKNPIRPIIGNNFMEGQIIYIDHFENVIVNITQQEFEAERKGRGFKILFRRDEVIEKISDTYADANEGSALAMFNSAGYLEVSMNKANAAGLFGLQGFNEKQQSVQNNYIRKQLYYQTIKIFFE